jgi:hypothetical protein
VKLVFEKVWVFEASDVAALMGTKAKAPEKALEFGTVFESAEATRVWVDRSSWISKVRYWELYTDGNMAERTSTFEMFRRGVDRYRVYEFEFGYKVWFRLLEST